MVTYYEPHELPNLKKGLRAHDSFGDQKDSHLIEYYPAPNEDGNRAERRAYKKFKKKQNKNK